MKAIVPRSATVAHTEAMVEEPEVDDYLNADEKLSGRNWIFFAEGSAIPIWYLEQDILNVIPV
jgi:hypothetical protein